MDNIGEQMTHQFSTNHGKNDNYFHTCSDLEANICTMDEAQPLEEQGVAAVAVVLAEVRRP